MVRPLLYIARPLLKRREDGSIKLHETDMAILTASEVALEAWYKGWAVICPHKNTAGFHHAPGIEWSDWIDGDLSILAKCDAILMLENYTTSKGAMVELDAAEAFRLPIHYHYIDGIPEPAFLDRVNGRLIPWVKDS